MKKKLLFVIPYMHEGGAQRALSSIQAHLYSKYEIDTLVNSEEDRVFPNAGKVISLHIDKEAKTDSVFFQFSAFMKRLIKLRQLKRGNNYDACISFMDSANITNILAGNKCKTIISVRISYRGMKNRPQYRLIVKPLAGFLYNRADAVVAVSEELKSELENDLKISPTKLYTITNGFDIKRINDLAQADVGEKYRKQLQSKRVIITAGRLDRQKHQWHLIRSFSRVLRYVPDAVLIVAGTGALETYLKQICQGLNVQNSVIFTGFVDNIYSWLKRSEVFVLPSCSEGFPNVLGEALCIGIPCIATDFRTGAREILAPNLLHSNVEIDSFRECEYGILSPVCSGMLYKGAEPLEKQEIELANAIIRLLTDNELNSKYHNKSIERGRSLDISSVVDKWIGVIEE